MAAATMTGTLSCAPILGNVCHSKTPHCDRLLLPLNHVVVAKRRELLRSASRRPLLLRAQSQAPGTTGNGDFEKAKENQWSVFLKSGVARNAVVVAMNVLLAVPALAGEEKGKIFDFNLTLPIIAIEFLSLMVALDNIWFKPVAAVMDQRDEDIRQKLLGVRDNSGEIQKLQDEAESVIKAARAETTASLNQTKKETAAALEISLRESKARIEKELAASLSNLEEQKEETLRGLDTQVQALSDAILGKVIPFSVK